MELKEIVGYLPHKIKAYAKDLDQYFTIVPFTPRDLETERTASEFMCYSDKLKPVLRKLETLTKEEINQLKNLVDSSTGYKSHIVSILKRTDLPLKYIMDKIPFSLIPKLYEWHFDIHGLIDKNEAIDVSSL